MQANGSDDRRVINPPGAVQNSYKELAVSATITRTKIF
jgi:hypothetical protein